MENTQIELSKPQKLLGAILILFLLIGGAFWLTKFIPFAEIFYTLKNENSKLNKEVIKLQADFDSMKKAKEEAENKVETCRNDPNFINQTVINLRKELAEANQTIADLKKNSESECQINLDAASAEVKNKCELECQAKLQSANQRFQKDLDTAKQTIDKLKNPDCKAQVDAAIEAADKAKKEAEDKAAKLQTDLDTAKQTIAGLRENSDCKSQVNAVTAEFRMKFQNSEQAKRNAENRANSLSSELSRMKSAKEEIERQLGNEKQSVTRLTDERNRLKTDLNNCRKQSSTQRLRDPKAPSSAPSSSNCDELKLKVETGRATPIEQSLYWNNCRK